MESCSHFHMQMDIMYSNLSMIALRASRNSYSSYNPIQNYTEVPNTLDRRNAVSTSNAAFTQHDLVNATRSNTDRLSQPGLADFH